jgi:LacI family transcriptional regulator
VVRAEQTVRELLALDLPPTAVFTTNNRLTTGALRALRDRADPPALVGFDDFDLADVIGTTVVAHDSIAMGREAARLAQQRISGDPSPAQTVVIATTVIPRGSGERPPRH